MKRCCINVSGLVQGVGFRPFIHRLAVAHQISGCVRNTLQGVVIEAEGLSSAVDCFLTELAARKPAAARITNMEAFDIPVTGQRYFRIDQSLTDGQNMAVMPHDRAICTACRSELFDQSNRRFRYPFITCNDCGPRFTIAEALPFDRARTTMRFFKMCQACHNEFFDPQNRRFHSQTISCPSCGPKLSFHQNGASAQNDDALMAAISVIAQGGLIATKGTGGYQLMCSALAKEGIRRIRAFKARKLKPFAVLTPNIEDVTQLCSISETESKFLTSPAAPVVLLYIKKAALLPAKVHPDVAPALSTLGIMLPPSPLHELLLAGARTWLVVTSANRRGESMLTDDRQAMAELEQVVDGILTNDRPIAHLADDSVVRAADTRMIVLRHARGLAPTEIRIAPNQMEQDRVGMGGHTKSAFALASKGRFILSQHLGELDSRRSREVFQFELQSFERLYSLDAASTITCCDANPYYGSTALAERRGGLIRSIYHHQAHLESLIVEKDIAGSAIAFVCDGSGLGDDQSLWGGELFLIDDQQRRRVGSILPFRLPGGEQGVKEPRRAAFGMLFETPAAATHSKPFLMAAFSQREQHIMHGALKEGINAPYTSSLGRLFDGFAALLGLCYQSDYEAQAAMAMEALAHEAGTDGKPFPALWLQDDAGLWRWDWRHLIGPALDARTCETSRRIFAAAFHSTIADAIQSIAERFQVSTVLLTGGVFQNALLVELCHKRLGLAGIQVVTHDLVPPGDGGLALGQVAATTTNGRGWQLLNANLPNISNLLF